jgi:hypothetical protein
MSPMTRQFRASTEAPLGPTAPERPPNSASREALPDRTPRSVKNPITLWMSESFPSVLRELPWVLRAGRAIAGPSQRDQQTIFTSPHSKSFLSIELIERNQPSRPNRRTIPPGALIPICSLLCLIMAWQPSMTDPDMAGLRNRDAPPPSLAHRKTARRAVGDLRPAN